MTIYHKTFKMPKMFLLEIEERVGPGLPAVLGHSNKNCRA